mmetsp:Transcript_9046/g.20272  ORF Transcript_9046/g.20272 Transcript_9046/m.20272 type:complete len:191 (+) Transcript_9046:167-739(+)
MATLEAALAEERARVATLERLMGCAGIAASTGSGAASPTPPCWTAGSASASSATSQGTVTEGTATSGGAITVRREGTVTSEGTTTSAGAIHTRASPATSEGTVTSESTATSAGALQTQALSEGLLREFKIEVNSQVEEIRSTLTTFEVDLRSRIDKLEDVQGNLSSRVAVNEAKLMGVKENSVGAALGVR